MSELISHEQNGLFRKQLLTTVSALTLGVCLAAVTAQAEDIDRPTVWIELGGQTEFEHGTSSAFTAPFMNTFAGSPVFGPVSPEQSQRPPRLSSGLEGSISIEPEGSDLVFSASIRYGRSVSNKNVHQQTHGLPVPKDSGFYQFFANYYQSYFHTLTEVEAYTHLKNHHSESHMVLDFQAGKDVGLGLFGKDVSSVVSVGVRLAKFDSSSTTKIWARPYANVDFSTFLPKYYFNWHNYHLSGSSARSFQGVGPSVSWSGSVPFAGNLNDGEFAFDWEANAAVLFGRQKMTAHHNITASSFSLGYHPLYHSSGNPNRSKTVAVPNIGGTAGISYRFNNARLKIGYRADMFFDAMDTGIDARKESDVLFHGPYASISIGLGG